MSLHHWARHRGIGAASIFSSITPRIRTFKDVGEISDAEWENTFKVNLHAMFYLTKAAVPHVKPGSAIIKRASVNADMPSPILLAYATAKGAIQNFTGGLAQMLAEKGIRADAVATDLSIHARRTRQGPGRVAMGQKGGKAGGSYDARALGSDCKDIEIWSGERLVIRMSPQTFPSPFSNLRRRSTWQIRIVKKPNVALTKPVEWLPLW